MYSNGIPEEIVANNPGVFVGKDGKYYLPNKWNPEQPYLIDTTRELVDYKKRLGKSRKEATYEAVRYTGAANCGEQAVLVSQKLDEIGIKNKVVSMNIRKNIPNCYYITDGHSFCVIDTADDMNIHNPDTWGEDAVVVDMWSNTVAKVKDAIISKKKILIYGDYDADGICSSTILYLFLKSLFIFNLSNTFAQGLYNKKDEYLF